MRMRYLSVCSGIEAVSVAWGPLGWQPAMFAEIDPFCAWLLRSRHGASRPMHMPDPHDAPTRKEAKHRAAAIRNVVALPTDGAISNAGDFTRIGADDVGTIDLLAGGTPCQSFSIAGKRAGLDDPRGNLTIEFARLAGRLRPLWLVWENVPGVLSIDDGRTFGAFLGMLVELGYGIAYRVLDAQHFGVPQRRRRVFVVGHLGNWRAAAAVLLEQCDMKSRKQLFHSTFVEMKPAVPSAVAYRCMRGRQRPGVKPSSQSNPPFRATTIREESCHLQAQCGWDARLDDTTNVSELPFSHRQSKQAKDAERLKTKGIWRAVSLAHGGTRIKTSSVKRQGLTHSLLFTRNMVSPYIRPVGASEPQGALMEMWVEESRKSECRPVIGRIGIEPRGDIISCESTQTSTGSFLAKHLMNLYRRESK